MLTLVKLRRASFFGMLSTHRRRRVLGRRCLLEKTHEGLRLGPLVTRVTGTGMYKPQDVDLGEAQEGSVFWDVEHSQAQMCTGAQMLTREDSQGP